MLSLASIASHRLDAVALNPQPLPPRDLLGSVLGRFNAVALNPQPLPPKEGGSPLQRLGLLAADDWCGTVPHKLPPLPPVPPSPWF